MTDEAARAKFIRNYGVLGWGVSTAVVFSVVVGWDRGFDLEWALIWTPLALLLFPLGGRYWGRVMWKVMQSNAEHAAAKQKRDA